MGERTARHRQKEAAWRRRLGEPAASGQSVRAWCREHQVTENSFYRWCQEPGLRPGKVNISAHGSAFRVPHF